MPKMTWCHRCHSKDRKIDSITGSTYQVVCQECGARGKPGSSIGSAIINWNTQDLLVPHNKSIEENEK